MATGQKISDKAELTGADYVFALYQGTSGPLSTTALGTILAASGAVADAITGKADSADLSAATARIDALEAIGATGAQYTSGGPVACATTANITLSGEQTIDGVTTSTDRVLVMAQTDPAENGIYVSAAGAWGRATDMDDAAEINGTLVSVKEGTENGLATFVTYSAVETLGTDAIEFREADDASAFSAALALKADAAAPVFTGDVDMSGADSLTVPTPSSDSHAATKAYVDGNIGAVLTSYSNSGGQGDRTATITVTASSGLIGTGTASNLVDGGTSNNTTDSMSFNAVSVAGHYLQFDFGSHAEKVVAEVTWKQSGTQEHGAWKWQGSADASTWTDIGSSFTLGGATSQTQTALSDNVTGYRYYRLLGVSGTASGGPYIQEVEFKIADAATAGYAKRTEISRFPADFPTDKLIAAYFFDEAGEGAVADVFAGYDIDLTGPTDPNATVTAHGVKLAAGLIETPELPGCQSQTLLYRTDYGGSSNGFVISGGSGSGNGALQRNLTTSEIHYIAGFGLGWFEPQMGSGGGAAYAMCSGQWALYHREDTAARNSIYGLGGRHSTTTSRCAEFEAGAAFFWNDTLTDAERDAVLLFVRQRAAARGVFIHRADPPEQASLYIIGGESNGDGRALIADLSAGDQAADYRHTMIVANEAIATVVPPDQFELGYNQKYHSSGFSVGTYVGPEIGVAKQRRADYPTDRKRALIYKNAKGGSQIAPTSTGVSANNTWNASEALDGSGLFWSFIRQMQVALGEYCARGIGFGDTVRVGLWIGLNDATDTAYTTDAATYQSYLQDWLDTLEEYLPGMTVEVEIFRAHNSDPSSDATALGHVRTATDDFATANSNVTATDTDAYGLEADDVHYDAAANVTMGAILHG